MKNFKNKKLLFFKTISEKQVELLTRETFYSLTLKIIRFEIKFHYSMRILK